MITKERYFHKPTYDSITATIYYMKNHALSNGVKHITMPKIGCGLDRLQWNNTSAEATSSSSKVDFHANGFRPILNNSEINGNDGIYIYAAWGSTPYKYSLAF